MKSCVEILLIVISILLLVSCDSGKNIVGDYYFSNVGELHTTIIKKNHNSQDEIVIDSRVDKVIIKDDKIYVARRPTLYYRIEGTTRVKLTDDCEYFIIEILTNTVREIHESEDRPDGLKCTMIN